MNDGTARGPLRTCVGCRRCVPATELLRVVVAGAAGGVQVTGPRLAPDPRRRAAGRGAWVHPDQRCVADAVRRRAFARALRVPGPVDPEPVVGFVSAASSTRQAPFTPGDTAP